MSSAQRRRFGLTSPRSIANIRKQRKDVLEILFQRQNSPNFTNTERRNLFNIYRKLGSLYGLVVKASKKFKTLPARRHTARRASAANVAAAAFSPRRMRSRIEKYGNKAWN